MTMQTFTRRKVELLADAPLARKMAARLDALQITGYTVFQSIGGHGAGGSWWHDQVSDAETKVLFKIVTSEAKAQALIDSLAPLLDDWGLILYVSTVEVIRGQKY